MTAIKGAEEHMVPPPLVFCRPLVQQVRNFIVQRWAVAKTTA
jgi:hypothetical protein